MLAVDIGNSRASFGHFSGAAPVARSSLPLARLEEADGPAWRAALALPPGPGRACIASVQPDAARALAARLRAGGWEVRTLGVELPLTELLPGPLPQGVGADRVVNALAAHQRFGAALVFDCGTALTCEVVDADGRLLGGSISPGLGLAARVLAERTALLPEVRLDGEPPALIGADTVGAIRAGLLYGWRGLVEGLLRRLRAELGPWPAVLTGGDAPRLLALPGPWPAPAPVLDPWLTLRGVCLAGRR